MKIYNIHSGHPKRESFSKFRLWIEKGMGGKTRVFGKKRVFSTKPGFPGRTSVLLANPGYFKGLEAQGIYTSLDVWKDGRVWIAMRRAAILLLLSCRCRHMVRERAKPDMMHYPLPVQAGTSKSVVEPFMAFIILHCTASFLRPWHHLWLQWIHERDQSGIASCEKVRYSAERGDWRCISLHISPLRGFFWKI